MDHHQRPLRQRLRSATPDDTAGIVALLSRHSPAARGRAETVVGRILRGPNVALVVDDPFVEGLSAALCLRPVESPTGHWAADVVDVRRSADEDHLVPLLLSAAADRLVRNGVSSVAVPASPERPERAAALRRASLQLDCWTMIRRRGIVRIDDEYEQGLPLPHLHGHRPLRPGRDLRTEDAGAWQTATMMPFDAAVPLEVVALLDPVIAPNAAALTRLLVKLGDPARTDDDDSRIAIAVGAGEDRLDKALDAAGFRRSVEWWRLDLVG